MAWAFFALWFCLSGQRFASAGADGSVIIWTDRFEAVLKYSHTEAVQCLAFNPISDQLASGSTHDFGMWSPEQRAVQKYPTSSKVQSIAWTSDGQFVALGQWNGHVSLRDQDGEEKMRIERSQPIWCLQWNDSSSDGVEILAVGCWDQTLSFYDVSGNQLGRDRRLSGDPLSLDFSSDGESVLVSTTSKNAVLYSREGICIKSLHEYDSWIWTACFQPQGRGIVRIRLDEYR